MVAGFFIGGFKLADNDDFFETDETTSATTTELKAVLTVKRDFQQAQTFLDKFHKQGVERYKHYVAPGLESRIEKDRSFPVPFTTEQIDTLTADMMEKLFYKDEPCSMYGRNDDDKDDAEAKRKFIKYQDEIDDIEDKVRQAIVNCCIYKIAPAVINFKEKSKIVQIPQEVPLQDVTGQTVMGLDGVTPMTEMKLMPKQVFTYQGATTELVDPLNFFWTQEKKELYDEHPLMIRSRVTHDWLKKQPFITKQGLQSLKQKREVAAFHDYSDLIDDRRGYIGFDTHQPGSKKQYQYVEWQGYFDPDGKGNKELYILGVINDDVLVRMQTVREVFDLDHPNIVVGRIGKETGEIYGLSLVDKFHSVQHGLDSLLGMWLAILRQTANPISAGDDTKMVTKQVKSEAGTHIRTRGNPNEAFMWYKAPQISQDIYAGIEMFTRMGQNAAGQQESSLGKADPGVDTLGEAQIVASNAVLRTKGGYLRSFETSFIGPAWKLRNHVNMKFCTDAGYLYSVIQDGIMHWRTIDPMTIRAEVDFVCEGSQRENQRAVVTQQVLQALNLTLKMAEILGPIPLIKLLAKLYEEGFGWKQDTIKELLPIEAIAQQLMQNEQQRQQELAAENPQNMPQPKTEGEATQSAQQKNATPVGGIG